MLGFSSALAGLLSCSSINFFFSSSSVSEFDIVLGNNLYCLASSRDMSYAESTAAPLKGDDKVSA